MYCFTKFENSFMKKVLLGVVMALPFTINAQNTNLHIPRCGHELVWKNIDQQNPGYKQQFYTNIEEQTSYAARPTGTIYDIPVVFHVVYYQNGTTVKGNIPDSVIMNQLAVLNGAFRKKHADTANVRSVFKPISADAEIQFHLATKDPQGNATTGITRTATNIEYFGDINFMMGDLSSIERIKKSNQGGKDPWNTKRYLNIWIADMSISFMGQVTPALMGIAIPPLNPAPPNWDPADVQGLSSLIDGVVLQFQVVGNNNPTIPELSQYGVGTAGRTAVHEVGHYLGMRHIWGDPEQNEACTPQGDDGIDDTPAQADKTDVALNPPPPTQNTCGAGTTNDLPDLWENYMDYSKDNFQAMFTQGQVALMRSICANQRDSLFSSNDQPNSIGSTNEEQNKLIVYPQPAGQYINFNFPDKIDHIRVMSITGATLITVDGTNANAQSKRIDVSDLTTGSYFLQILSNGHLYTKKIVVLQ